MSGSVLSVLSATCFALSAICTRRGVLKVTDSSVGVMLSNFLAVPLFALILLGMGQMAEVGAFTWQEYIFLAIAGIFHFIVGRSFYYLGIQIVGANMANILVSGHPFYSVVSGLIIFHEPLTRELAVGASLVIAGILLIVWGPMASGQSRSLPSGVLLKGILSALAAGLIYGLTPIPIKWGLGAGGSPEAGTFISYVAAAAVSLGMLSSKSKRDSFMGMGRGALLWFSFGGFFVGMAQLFRYIALTLIPMSRVGPLIAISPLLVILFSFIVNRNLETFRIRVILGGVAVVSGTYILFG
ncbi:MAG: DMT family transporter [Dehalococcoidia bacterium]